MQKNILITLLLSIFIAVFAILNAAAVPVNLVFTTINISAALVILISASLGAAIVYLMDTITKMKNRKIMKEQEKTVVNLTTENQTVKLKNSELEAELKLLHEQIDIINDNIEKDNIEKDNIERENIERENIEKENIRKENTLKENIEKENIEKENIKKENILKDNIEKDNIEKE